MLEELFLRKWETLRSPSLVDYALGVKISFLARLGYEPGLIDGRPGPRTSAAVRRYQRDHGLPADGKLTGQVALHIEEKAAGLPK